MTWDFILSIILGIAIGALICRFTDNKKQEKSMGYELLKEQMNKFHDVLFRTDTTVRKRFISNPNKTNLPKSDILAILASISELESMIPLVKQCLMERLVVPEQQINLHQEQYCEKPSVVDDSTRGGEVFNFCRCCGKLIRNGELKIYYDHNLHDVKLCEKCYDDVAIKMTKKVGDENDVSQQS